MNGPGLKWTAHTSTGTPVTAVDLILFSVGSIEIVCMLATSFAWNDTGFFGRFDSNSCTFVSFSSH